MALSPWWLFNTALGNSEGLLAAAVLWAVLAHLAGRTRLALAVGTAAALLRPEVWPFLGLYGLWLWRADRAARPAVVAAAIVVPALWLGPDLLGIGGALSASRAARGEPSLGSAALEDVPGLAVLADAVSLLTVPAAVAAVVGTIAGGPLARVLAAARGRLDRDRRRDGPGRLRRQPPLPRGGDGLRLRPRRRRRRLGRSRDRARRGRSSRRPGRHPRVHAAAPGSAPARRHCERSSAAAGTAATASLHAAGPAAAVVAAVLVVAVGAVTLGDLREQVSDVGARADRRAALPDVVAAAGGRDALVDCARVRTAPDVRPLVAWELDISMLGIDRPPAAPATVLRWSPHGGGPTEPAIPDGFRLLGRAPYWEAWGACTVRR